MKENTQQKWITFNFLSHVFFLEKAPKNKSSVSMHCVVCNAMVANSPPCCNIEVKAKPQTTIFQRLLRI